MAERVADPGNERRLGADDHEVDREPASQREQSFAVLGANRMARAEPRDAGVAGRGVEARERGALRELPRERMLTPPGADDQDFHRRERFGPARRAQEHVMSAQEPGLDLHEWTSRFEAIEPDLRDDPAGALPELRRLVEDMLRERGYEPDDPVASEGDDPEVLATFASARELALRAEGDGVDPSDIGEAVHGFVAVYEYLIAERPAP
jgi:hypothetical protein